MKRDRVPVVELRAAVLASDVGWTTAARRLGWIRSDTGVGDGARLKRMVGVLPSYSTRARAGGGRHQYVYTTKTIDYVRAVQIADAYGLDYVDVGL